jgi:disulfide bond formation protein DsbB
MSLDILHRCMGRHGPMHGCRATAQLLLLGAAAVIGGALLFQYVGGLEPCEMCLLERWPYYIGIPLLLAAQLAHRHRGAALLVFGLASVLFLGSTALAFYHVGVEQHWFLGPTACTARPSDANSIEAMREQLMAMQPVRCDVVQWSLFGISLAGWNFIASVILAGLSLAGLGHAWRLDAPARA